METLADRNVVVTGGAGALGAAVVAVLEADGARVHVPRDVDFTVEDAVAAYYATLPPLWASVHLIGGFAMKPVTDTTLGDLRAMHDVNVVTCFLAAREAVRVMRRTGAGGRIVNVTARPALVPAGGMVAYSTAKAGVASLTQCLAAEVLDDGILVNAIVPSMIDTPMNRKNLPDADFSRWPKPAEIAQCVRRLIAPENTLTSGVLETVYGRA